MKLLVVEDEIDLANSIKNYLTNEEFNCEWAANCNAALDKIARFDYDCILLDLSLPDGNGLEILQELKKQNKTDGVIIISAKETLETKLDSFNLGADDYLTKPFHLSELLVRVQALIRRKNFKGNNLIVFNEIEIDVFSKGIKVNNTTLELTKSEWGLILFLVANQNKVLAKSAIAEHLSGEMADLMDNYDFIYAHIKNVKKKLKEKGCKDYIKTIYGLGYKWCDE